MEKLTQQHKNSEGKECIVYNKPKKDEREENKKTTKKNKEIRSY